MLEVVVHNLVIELRGLTKLFFSIGHTNLDIRRHPSVALLNAAAQLVNRRRQDENGLSIGIFRLEGLNALDVDIHDRALPYFPGIFQRLVRSAVKVRMNLCPLNEEVIRNIFFKFVVVDEVVLKTVAFALTDGAS